MKKLVLLGLLAFSALGIAEPYRDERGVLFMSEEEWVKKDKMCLYVFQSDL